MRVLERFFDTISVTINAATSKNAFKETRLFFYELLLKHTFCTIPIYLCGCIHQGDLRPRILRLSRVFG